MKDVQTVGRFQGRKFVKLELKNRLLEPKSSVQIYINLYQMDS